jgi:protein-disulfide isomerase
MKKIATLSLSAFIIAMPLNSIAAPATMPDDQKSAYSLGLYMGGQIKSSLQTQGIDVNQDAFTKGLKDGVIGATPALTSDEIQKSLSALQQQAQTKVDSKVRTLAAAHANELFGAQQSIVAGNPNGKVTLVEFSDYECPHCKAMTPLIDELIKANKDLRVVYRPFPIINANSTNAAMAVLAAQAQGKFSDLHTEMMASTAPLTDEQIGMLLKKVRIDTKKYDVAIKGSRIKEELKANRDLGIAVGLRGTPSFLIARTVTNPDDKQTWPNADQIFFASGELPETTLKDYIDKAAGGDKAADDKPASDKPAAQ